MNLTSLVALKEKVLASAGLLTFSIENVEANRTKSGQMAFRATCDTGEVVSFWESTADRVIEEIEPGKFRLLAGTDIANNGGLIPGGSRKDYWS